MRMTERRLKRVIRQVIRETYEFPTKSGMELLEKIFMDMIPLGGSYNLNLMDLIELVYGDCASCEFVNVVPFKTGDGASFGIKEAGSDDVEQFELFLNSTNRPEIIAL